MKSIIADDEVAARSRLRRLLAAHAEVDVIGEARDGLEAVAKIEQLRPDLLFLDIEMPGLAGFDVLRSIPATVPLPLVIFVTGFDQHALAAFEADALAYLLKPVDPEQLTRAIDRARRLHALAPEKEREQEFLRRATQRAPQNLRQIVGRRLDRMVLLRPDEVRWFQVESGIIRAHTATESYAVNFQLTELEAGLPDDRFFRARREALVNLDHVREIKPYFKSGLVLVMSDSAATPIVVSERRVPLLRERMPGL